MQGLTYAGSKGPDTSILTDVRVNAIALITVFYVLQVLQEMKAITLWYNVAKDLRLGQEIVLAASSLMNCLVKVGMVEAASQVAEQNLGAADALEEGIPKLRFLLARSNMLYAKEQVL